MCCAPIVYMFVYILIGAHIVPLTQNFVSKASAFMGINDISADFNQYIRDITVKYFVAILPEAM